MKGLTSELVRQSQTLTRNSSEFCNRQGKVTSLRESLHHCPFLTNKTSFPGDVFLNGAQSPLGLPKGAEFVWPLPRGAPSLQRLNQLVLALFRFAEPGLLWWSGLGIPRKHSLFENSGAFFMREPESGRCHAWPAPTGATSFTALGSWINGSHGRLISLSQNQEPL